MVTPLTNLSNAELAALRVRVSTQAQAVLAAAAFPAPDAALVSSPATRGGANVIRDYNRSHAYHMRDKRRRLAAEEALVEGSASEEQMMLAFLADSSDDAATMDAQLDTRITPEEVTERIRRDGR